MTVASEVAALVTHVDNLTAIKRVWSHPPENINEFPSAVVYASSGELGSRMRDAICPDGTHVLAVDILTARQMLPQAVATSLPWIDDLFTELRASSTLYILYPIRYQAGALQYGDATFYGVHFEVTVRD